MTIQASDLQKQLPELVGDGSILAEAFSVDADSLNQTEADRLDVFNQMFAESGTWGLKFWEVFLGIETDETQSVETRRKIIKNKIVAGTLTFSPNRLRKVIEDYGFSVYAINENFGTYSVEIQVLDYVTDLKALKKLAKYLRAMFPAHLGAMLTTMGTNDHGYINIDEIGPIVLNGSESQLAVLGGKGSVTLHNIYVYDTLDMIPVKTINIGDNYPGYNFDTRSAAMNFSGSKMYIACTEKAASNISLEARGYHQDIGYGRGKTPDKLNVTCTSKAGEVTQNTDVKVYDVADRATGELYFDSFSLELTCHNLWDNDNTRDGITYSGESADVVSIAPKLHAGYYQFFDKDDVAIGTQTEIPQTKKAYTGPAEAEYLMEIWYNRFRVPITIPDHACYIKVTTITNPTTAKFPPNTTMHYISSEATVTIEDVVVKTNSVIAPEWPSPKTYLELTMAETAKTASRRFIVGNRLTGEKYFSKVALNMEFYNTFYGTYYDNFLKMTQTDGKMLSNNIDATNPLSSAFYRFFDKNNTALTARVQLDTSTAYVAMNRNYVDVEINVPANAVSMEITTISRKTSATAYEPYAFSVDNRFPATTWRWAKTMTNIKVSGVLSADPAGDTTWLSQFNTLSRFTNQRYCQKYIAVIDMDTGAVTFNNAHTLLGIPKIKRSFYQESVTWIDLKFHYNTHDNNLYCIYGYDTGYNPVPRTDRTKPVTFTKNTFVHAAKLNTSTLEVIGKVQLQSNSVDAVTTYVGLTTDAGTETTFPPYNADTIDDYLPNTAISKVCRQDHYVDDSFAVNSFIVRGLVDDYLVLLSKSVKESIFTYYGNSVGYAPCFGGFAIRNVSNNGDIVKYPSIKVVNLSTLTVRSVTDPAVLELCRTSCRLSDVFGGSYDGPNSIHISENVNYGLPLIFPEVRKVTPTPPLSGAGNDSLYTIPKVFINGTRTAIGHSFVMAVLDVGNLAQTMRYEYLYDNKSGQTYTSNNKIPLAPTNITSDLALWMDTAYELSLPGQPRLLDTAHLEPNNAPAVKNKEYYNSYFGSLYYPYSRSPQQLYASFDGEVVTSILVDPTTRPAGYPTGLVNHSIPSYDFYTNHSTDRMVYAAFDTTLFSNPAAYTNKSSEMGKKLGRMKKTNSDQWNLWLYA